MLIVACKCLNITANISDDDIDLSQKPFSADGPVSPSATTAPNSLEFLKEAVGPFTNPSNLRIETKHDELTAARRLPVTPRVGATHQLYVLVNCIICDQAVYATRATLPRKSISSVDEPVHRNEDFAVVFNGKLLTTLEGVQTLKLDENYSKIYKVVIRQPSSSFFSMLSSSSSSSSPPKSTNATADTAVDLVNSSDPRLKNLMELLVERLRKETEATEERIREFTADQFMGLRVFRQAAESEFVHLAQKLRSESAQPPNELLFPGDKKLISISIVGGNLLETPPLTPDSGIVTGGHSPPRLLNIGSARSLAPIMNSSSAGSIKMASRLNVLRKRNSDGAAAEEEEDFFGMDGFFPGNCTDGTGQPQPMSDFDEDFDEEDELYDDDPSSGGRHIPRPDYTGQSSGGMVIAKSLPIPTPGIPGRPLSQEESEERSEDNLDIAASMKALAKSVHGSDAIFGDLPRPRLRTKI